MAAPAGPPMADEPQVWFRINYMTQALVQYDRKNRGYERVPIVTEELRRGIDESDRLIRRLNEVRYEMANAANLFAVYEMGPTGDTPLVPPGANPFQPIPRDKFNAILEKARVLHWKIIDLDRANADEADRIWGLPAAPPAAAGPPGAEGRGIPHMRREEYWQAGVNRRR